MSYTNMFIGRVMVAMAIFIVILAMVLSGNYKWQYTLSLNDPPITRKFYKNY